MSNQPTDNDAGKVLLIEDSTMFGRLAKGKIESVFHRPVVWVKSYSDAEALLEEGENAFAMALLDFNLPDAPRGEIIARIVL
jgi:hypothetical protein